MFDIFLMPSTPAHVFFGSQVSFLSLYLGVAGAATAVSLTASARIVGRF
jgi:hypothetical protein